LGGGRGSLFLPPFFLLALEGLRRMKMIQIIILKHLVKVEKKGK
jgi:hypothetical protein